MRSRLEDAMRRPASTREILLVLGPPMALSIASSIMLRVRHPGNVVFTNRDLLLSMLVQAIIAACLLPYLYRRRWTPTAVAGIPEAADVTRGIGLWLGLLGIFYLTFLVVYLIDPNVVAGLKSHQFTGSLAPAVIVIAAVFDPIFEEFLWLGYAVPALGNRLGIRAASIGSVLLRVVAHGYQGRLAIIAILPVAIILTWYFVRTGRLWPVIVAHVVQDAIALSVMVAAT